tara:strand:+ start:1915 stop:2508 length:594 start_codon:yes stop_codon:yes gene_type:complete
MSDKVKIPVDLDTREAKSKLKQLSNEKSKTKKRITATAKRTSQMAIRAFSFTGAASVVGKFQTNDSVGNVDLISESLVPVAALAQQMADDELGFSSRARKTAREQTKTAFAIQVGETGQMAGATDFFNTVSKIQNDVESGRNILRQDQRFIGPTVGDAVESTVDGKLEIFLRNIGSLNAFSLLLEGFDYIIEGINAD